MKVAVQGFGNVGRSIAQLLYDDGYKIIAISDSKGGVYKNKGLDIPHIIELINSSKKEESLYCKDSISDLVKEDKITNEELLELDADLLIPAAAQNQITKKNASKIKAPVIIEIANGPITVEADKILEKRKY